MTRIIYSVLSSMMLIMGVLTFDYWGNTINIPDDKSGEIQEVGLFPARHIRPSPRCRCGSEIQHLPYGETHHPRYLVSHRCSENDCVEDNICKNIEYSLNVSSLKYRDSYGTPYSPEVRRMCLDMWDSEVRTISVACIRVPPFNIN